MAIVEADFGNGFVEIGDATDASILQGHNPNGFTVMCRLNNTGHSKIEDRYMTGGFIAISFTYRGTRLAGNFLVQSIRGNTCTLLSSGKVS